MPFRVTKLFSRHPIFSLLLLLLVTWLLFPTSRQPIQENDNMSLENKTATQNDMWMKLTHRLSLTTEYKDQNLVFSPVSLYVVLSLIAAGSSGLTRKELLGFLKSESIDEVNKFSSEIASYVVADGSPVGGPRLQFVNGVWIDEKLRLKPSFEEVVHGVYKAAVENVDFSHKANEVTSKVNSWAEKQTNGLIKEVLPNGSVTGRTQLIITNALCFKGSWNIKFDASKTMSYDFHLLNGGSIQVPFMASRENHQFLRKFEDCKVVRLPYKQGLDLNRQFSMYIFLPHARDGLPSLMEKLSSQPGFLEKHLTLHKVEVDQFRLPKFKISFGFETSNVLKSLGVEKPFKAGGITEMVDSYIGDELYVESIFEKSFIEVNEEGTEAAAVTAVVAVNSINISDPENFVADHPFMFMIREDNTGVVLFIGHVMDPSS